MKKRTITAFQNASAADDLRPHDRHGQVPVELELVDEEWWACPVCDGEEAPDVLTCARCLAVRS